MGRQPHNGGGGAKMEGGEGGAPGPAQPRNGSGEVGGNGGGEVGEGAGLAPQQQRRRWGRPGPALWLSWGKGEWAWPRSGEGEPDVSLCPCPHLPLIIFGGQLSSIVYSSNCICIFNFTLTYLKGNCPFTFYFKQHSLQGSSPKNHSTNSLLAQPQKWAGAELIRGRMGDGSSTGQEMKRFTMFLKYWQLFWLPVIQGILKYCSRLPSVSFKKWTRLRDNYPFIPSEKESYSFHEQALEDIKHKYMIPTSSGGDRRCIKHSLGPKVTRGAESSWSK